MTRSSHLTMGDGAEFDLIRGLLATWGPRAAGIGDDAAVLDIPAGERLVVSTDASVDGVHFRREWLSAEEIGARAAAAALSDLAAMAAVPRGMLLALGVPDSWREALEAIARGVGMVAGTSACPIIGGNITASRELSLTITVLGSAATPVTRDGVQEGDIIYVTGTLGGPGAALRSLLAGEVPAPEHRARFAAPVPRIAEAQWLAARSIHAAIDISDGLLADAAHLARASRISIALDAATIPRVRGVSALQAAASGEEYELLVAASPMMPLDMLEFGRRFGTPLTVVGSAVAPRESAVMLDGSGMRSAPGHDHFI